MKRFSLFFIVILLTSIFAVSAQNTANRPVITLDNAASVTQLTTLEGHKGAVNSVAFSPDGTLLASGGADKTVRLWDTATMTDKHDLEGHKDGVLSLSFNADGSLLASTGYDLNVLVWNTQDGTLSDQSIKMDESTAGFFDVVANKNIGFHALTWFKGIPIAAGDGGVAIFTSRINYSDGDPTIYSFDISSSGLIASGMSDGVRVVSIDSDISGKVPALGGNSEAVLAAKFDATGKLLASASADTVRLWNAQDPRNVEAVATLEGHQDQVTGVAFSPDGTLLVSSSLDGTLRLWDVKAQKEITTLLGPDGTKFIGVAFSPDGTLIASAGDDGIVRLWGINDESSAATQAPSSNTDAGNPTIKTGRWEGDEVATGFAGDVSFQVTSDGKISNFRIKVPVFGDTFNQGCETTVQDPAISIQPDGTFVTRIEAGDTQLDLNGKVSSDTTLSFSAMGVCQGSLVLFGVTFDAKWVNG